MSDIQKDESIHTSGGPSPTENVTQPKIIYMYWEDNQWVQRDRPLPPPPVCLVCGKPSNWLMYIGYGSVHDEDWICPGCLDAAIVLSKAKMCEKAK